MRRKFSTFAEKAKLKKIVHNDVEHSEHYSAPKGHVVIFNNKVVSVVEVYPAFRALNPMGGVDEEAEVQWMRIITSDDDDEDWIDNWIEEEGDLVGNWMLLKKVC